LDEVMVPAETEMENNGEIASPSTTQRMSQISQKEDGGMTVRIHSCAAVTQSAAPGKTFRFAKGAASIIMAENGATKSGTKVLTLKVTGQKTGKAEHLWPAELGELMVPRRRA
jgi:hypothetical protein